MASKYDFSWIDGYKFPSQLKKEAAQMTPNEVARRKEAPLVEEEIARLQAQQMTPDEVARRKSASFMDYQFTNTPPSEGSFWGGAKDLALDTLEQYEKVSKGVLNTYDKTVRPALDEVGDTLLDNPVGKGIASGNPFLQNAIEGMSQRAPKTTAQNPLTAFQQGYANPDQAKPGQVLFNENYTGGMNVPGMAELVGMKEGLKTPSISELGGLGIDAALDPLNVPIFKGAQLAAKGIGKILPELPKKAPTPAPYTGPTDVVVEGPRQAEFLRRIPRVYPESDFQPTSPVPYTRQNNVVPYNDATSTRNIDDLLSQLSPGKRTNPNTQPLLNAGGKDFHLYPGLDLSAPKRMIEGPRIAGLLDDPQQMKFTRELDSAIEQEFQQLKKVRNKPPGVLKGGVIMTDAGDVTSRYGSVSNNPQWYRDFYAQHGRKPTNDELRQIARDRVMNGYKEDGVSIPAFTGRANEIDSEVSNIIEQLARTTDEQASTRLNQRLEELDVEYQRLTDDSPFIAEGPQMPRNKEPIARRDALRKWLEKQEQAAMNRIKSRGTRLNSLPLDDLADYAIVGAAKVGKGLVRFADWAEDMVRTFGDGIKPKLREIYEESHKMNGTKPDYSESTTSFDDMFPDNAEHAEELKLTKPTQYASDTDVGKLKDISGMNAYWRDVHRNFQEVFGSQYPKIKKRLLDPFDAAKRRNVQAQEQWLSDLKKNVVDKLGIQKGSKESALVQQFGEKEMNEEFKKLYDEGKMTYEMLEELNKDILKEKHPDLYEKIIAADKWFRQAYDQLIDQVNESRRLIYPNNPEKIVPKRRDYYRHFQEMTELSGLKNLFDSPAGIDPSLVGVSDFTLPKSKFAGFMQKRGLGPFKRDAVGGFLEYIPAANYSIHIDPFIDQFKGLAREMADQTKQSKHLNHFIEFLLDYSRDLAGKTNVLDRAVQKMIPGGRKTMAVLHWFNNRVKANVILGNVGSALSQVANVPNGVAFAKKHAVPGAIKGMSGANAEAMQQSGFLKERFLQARYREFNQSWFQQPRKFAEWMIETTDRVGTTFVWNSAYEKGVAEGVANPVKYADDHTRRLIAGRGIGEVPIGQKSKLVQFFAPFQLEVANLWRVQKDFINEKDFAGLMTLFIGNFLINRMMEEARGSGVVFDPVNAVLGASGIDVQGFTHIENKNDEMTPLKRGGRLAGEVLSNIPFGQHATAAFYPEYGFNVLGAEMPTRKELFGESDPTRFGGTGIVAAQGLTDPLFKAVLPFGGNQVKKLMQGTDAIAKGGAYKNDITNAPFSGGTSKEGNELKFPVKDDAIRALLFGPGATKAGQEYYREDGRPLSVKDTTKYNRTQNPDKFYDQKMKQRNIEKIDRLISELKKNKEMSKEEKRKELKKLLERKKETIKK